MFSNDRPNGRLKILSFDPCQKTSTRSFMEFDHCAIVEASWSSASFLTSIGDLFQRETILLRSVLEMVEPVHSTLRGSSSFQLSQVTFDDLSTLRSVFSQSFHPVSAFMCKAIPDTPVVCKWWDEVNHFAFEEKRVHLMKVIDTAANDKIIAMARWRLPDVGSEMAPGAGTWTAVPLTPDHDQELCDAFIEFLAKWRTAVMQDRPHYCTFLGLMVTI